MIGPTAQENVMKRPCARWWCAWRRLIVALLSLAFLWGGPAHSNLRSTPTWFDTNAVGTAPDWHFRVPITIPNNTGVNSTVRVDIDFAALLAQMGVTGTLDGNSPRIVRSTGALSTTQEFTDRIFAGTTDPSGNARGEIRFLVEDAGPTTYYLYFDISQNGAKPAWPAANTIDGNFEFSTIGTEDPPGWTATKTNVNFDSQVRPSESPSVTTNFPSGGGSAIVGPNPRTTDGTPNTGDFSYLIGARTNNEPSNANPGVTLTRTITVPSTNPGNLTLRYRVEGWDSSANSATQTQYDFLRIQLIGSTTTQVIGPMALNYTSFPYSPNLRLGAATATQSGYRQYNGWDTDTNGNHRNGMTIAPGTEPWFMASVSLASYAGQTITLRISSTHTTLYKSWFHIDDVEWSVVNGTLGMPQAFGANVTAPNDTTAGTASSYSAGSRLLIQTVVDSAPSVVVANVYSQNGTLVAANVRLYNDGTHGDTTAGDNVWTNNGTVAADPTYTFLPTDPVGTNWLVRSFALDGSTGALGAPNGAVHIPGQPNAPVQANYYNIDEQTFTVTAAFTINGRVFLDNGFGGGTAHDVIQNGGEAGLSGVTVRLTDSTGATTHATAATGGDGTFSLVIPNTLTTGTVLRVVEDNPAGHISTGGQPGTTGGAYNRSDYVTFTLMTNTSYTGVNFGDVPPNTFMNDNQRTILPGSTAFHPHTFTAGTAGTVGFSLTPVATPAGITWTQFVYRDLNCNGLLDGAEGSSLLTGSVPVVAASTVCIIVKENAPANAPFNAQDVSTVTATFTYAPPFIVAPPPPPPLTGVLTKTDATIVGNATNAGLALLKTVDKTTAFPGENLVYVITYLNNSSGSLTNIVINDATPNFTTFNSAACGSIGNGLTGCSVSTQPAAGATGSVQWTLTGALLSSGSGTVTYTVQIQP
jgi:uncharacterized repeat protein (TIGR01451 family)